jgi:hypothetical protein
MADNLEAGTNVLQHLCGICTQFPKLATTVGAGLMVGHVGVDFARKMFRQRLAEGLRGNGAFRWRDCLQLFGGAGGVQLFQLQLELLDLMEDLLTPGAEEHALQLLDQQNEALNLARARAERCHVLLTLRTIDGLLLEMLLLLGEQERLQRGMIHGIQIRQAEIGEHERSMA